MRHPTLQEAGREEGPVLDTPVGALSALLKSGSQARLALRGPDAERRQTGRQQLQLHLWRLLRKLERNGLEDVRGLLHGAAVSANDPDVRRPRLHVHIAPLGLHLLQGREALGSKARVLPQDPHHDLHSLGDRLLRVVVEEVQQPLEDARRRRALKGDVTHSPDACPRNRRVEVTHVLAELGDNVVSVGSTSDAHEKVHLEQLHARRIAKFAEEVLVVACEELRRVPDERVQVAQDDIDRLRVPGAHQSEKRGADAFQHLLMHSREGERDVQEDARGG